MQGNSTGTLAMCVKLYGTITMQRDLIVDYQRTTRSRCKSVSRAAKTTIHFVVGTQASSRRTAGSNPERSVSRTQEENLQPHAQQIWSINNESMQPRSSSPEIQTAPKSKRPKSKRLRASNENRQPDVLLRNHPTVKILDRSCS
jgi:hypothetical protein